MKTKNFTSIANDELLEWNAPVEKFYYQVRMEDMEPKFRLSDTLILYRCEGDFVQGRPYVIDTIPYGKLLRFLKRDGDIIKAHSTNEEQFPAVEILPKEILGVYDIIALLRLNL